MSKPDVDEILDDFSVSQGLNRTTPIDPIEDLKIARDITKAALYQRLASEAVGCSSYMNEYYFEAVPLSKLAELFGEAAPKSNVGDK